MLVYPAIDLRGGRVVRLQKGDYDLEQRYELDPLALAKSYAVAGASWLHVVDLDGARSGDSANLAAIDVLVAMPGPRWLILGDMGEVGSQGPQFHAEVGQRAREQGIDKVWAVGELGAFVAAHRHFYTVAELLAALPAELLVSNPAASVLVKGSRFMKMEQVVKALQMESARAA